MNRMVLILVVMERGGSTSLKNITHKNCLNPCCNGKGRFDNGEDVWAATLKDVLILVVMERGGSKGIVEEICAEMS